MWGALVKIITGDVLGQIREAYEAKLAAETDDQRIAADLKIEELKHKYAVQKSAGSRWEMRLIALVAGLPAALHFAAICYDSIFRVEGWSVAALPAPYDSLQVGIITTLFGIAGLKRILRG